MQTQVRLMKKEEAAEVKEKAKKAFGWVEGLFIGDPKWAYVIQVDGEIAGAMLLEDISKGVKTAYLDYAFISKDYQGQGLGKQLCTYVVDTLSQEGYEAQIALVRADNVGSWKPLIDRGFEKGRLRDLINAENQPILKTLLFKTPFSFAYGMNYYIKNQNTVESEPTKSVHEWLSFIVINVVLVFLNGLLHWGNKFYYIPLAYLIVLGVLNLGRYIGTTLSPQHQWTFEGTQGGIGLSFILNLFGIGSFPIHGSFYPESWKARKIQRDLALVEVFGLVCLVGLALFTDGQTGWLRLTNQIAELMLFLYIPSFYPFNEYGGKRIYDYSSLLWAGVAIISAIVIFVI